MAVTWSDVVYMGGTAYDVGIEAVLVSDNNYKATYRVDLYCSTFLYAGQTVSVSQYVSVTGHSQRTWSGSLGDGNKQFTTSMTYEFVKSNTTSKQVSFSVTGYLGNYSATATVWATISQGNWHTVTYDANGGTNAPSSQIKIYGYILTLSSTTPVKSITENVSGSDIPIVKNYEFCGWKSSFNSKIYQPGSSYGADKDTNMVAQWSPKTNNPIISIDNLYRTISTDSEVEATFGSAARCNFKIKIDRTFYSINELKNISGSVEIDGEASTNQVYTFAGNVVTTVQYIEYEYAASFSLPSDSRATLTLTVSDTQANNIGTSSVSIGVAHVPLELAHGGKSIGLLTSAGPEESISIGSITLSDVHEPDEITFKLSDLVDLLSLSVSKVPWTRIYTNGGQGVWYKTSLGFGYLRFVLEAWTGPWQVPANIPKKVCPPESCYFSIGRTTNNTASVWVGTDGAVYFYCFDKTNVITGIVSWPLA